MINFIIDKKVDGPNIDLQGYFREILPLKKAMATSNYF